MMLRLFHSHEANIQKGGYAVLGLTAQLLAEGC